MEAYFVEDCLAERMHCLLKLKLQLYQLRRAEELLNDVHTVVITASKENVLLIEVETGILSTSIGGENKVIFGHD